MSDSRIKKEFLDNETKEKIIQAKHIGSKDVCN